MEQGKGGGAAGLFRDWRLVPGVLYVGAALLVLLALYFGSFEHPNRSDAALTVAMLASLAAFVAVLARGRLAAPLARDLFVCYLPFAALWLLSLASPLPSRSTILYGSSQLLVWLGFVALVLPAALLLLVWLKGLSLEQMSGFFRRHWALCLAVLAFVVLSLEALTMWGTVDSTTYAFVANGALTWNFSLEDAARFKFCGHQPFLVAPWFMVGAFLTPGDHVGLRLVNILLLVSSIACFYCILLRLSAWLSQHRLVAALLTCVYAFNPLVLGTVYEMNLDTPCMVFLTWLAAAFVCRRPVLFTFSAFSLVFSKEVGFVLLAGFLLGQLVSLLARRLSKRNANTGVDYLFVAVSFVVSLSALLALRFIPYWMSNNADGEYDWTAATGSMGFDPAYVIQMLKHFFVLNYSWVLVSITLLGALVFVIRGIVRRRRGDVSRPAAFPVVLPLVGAYGAFLAFSLVYQTFLNPRYVTPHVPLLALAAVAALTVVLANKRALVATASLCLGGALLVQNVVTCDPLMRETFGHIDIGKTEIATSLPGNVAEFGPPSTYNRQMGYQDVAFERLLAHIGYDDDTLVLFDDLYGSAGPPSRFVYHNVFSWETGRERTFYFDAGSGRVLFLFPNSEQATQGATVMNLDVAPVAEKVDLSAYSRYSRVFFVSAPWRTGFEQCRPVEGLPVLEEGVVGYRYWQMEYYRIK
jgi:hypothetical protein